MHFIFPHVSKKGVQGTREAFSPQNKTSFNKHEVSDFFLFLWVIFPPWSGSSRPKSMRIRIHNTASVIDIFYLLAGCCRAECVPPCRTRCGTHNRSSCRQCPDPALFHSPGKSCRNNYKLCCVLKTYLKYFQNISGANFKKINELYFR